MAGNLVVIDTNVFVSACLSEHQSPPTEIAMLVWNNLLKVGYDERIMKEYLNVFHRPELELNPDKVQMILTAVKYYGVSVTPFQLEQRTSDPDDQPFYEVAALCFCPLVTGNKKHFPDEPHIVTPAEYIESMRGE